MLVLSEFGFEELFQYPQSICIFNIDIEIEDLMESVYMKHA